MNICEPINGLSDQITWMLSQLKVGGVLVGVRVKVAVAVLVLVGEREGLGVQVGRMSSGSG